MRKDPLAKRRKHQKDTYMYDNVTLKYYGSMFFRFYSILCFSDFNCKLYVGINKELKKKIDTKILIALELVKFTTTHNRWANYWKEKNPISFRNLVIVRGLIFDRESAWNEELRGILKRSNLEYILDYPTPVSYDRFFSDIDSDGIDKINFRKFLNYLPKELFIDAVALILKCNRTVRTYPDDLWDNKILGMKRGECSGCFIRAVKAFVKKLTQKELLGRVPEYKFIDSSEWLALFNNKSGDRFMKKLDWDANRFGYHKQYRGEEPSAEKRTSTMEQLLQGIVDRKKEEEEQIKKNGFKVIINGKETTLVKPTKNRTKNNKKK